MPHAGESSQMNHGIAGQPGLGEGDQLRAVAWRPRRSDRPPCRRGVEVEEHRRGLHGGGAELGVLDGHGGLRCWGWRDARNAPAARGLPQRGAALDCSAHRPAADRRLARGPPPMLRACPTSSPPRRSTRAAPGVLDRPGVRHLRAARVRPRRRRRRHRRRHPRRLAGHAGALARHRDRAASCAARRR